MVMILGQFFPNSVKNNCFFFIPYGMFVEVGYLFRH